MAVKLNIPKIADKALSYTSRGNKLVFHPEHLDNFLAKNGRGVISAHIAPTNKCNLSCSYCNQSGRDKGKFLDLKTIQDFVLMLKERGLKAAIVTGGGEPTVYPQFNKLVTWLKNENLDTALITNGTNNMAGKEKIDVWDAFTWVRVSLNFLNGNLREVKVPKIKGDMGLSMVYQSQNLEAFKHVQNVANNLDAKYIRVLPDCTQAKDAQLLKHDELREIVDKLSDSRFFIQDKIPQGAVLNSCHQSKLRPFLLPTGEVAPCDCFMMNKDASGNFYKSLPPKFNLAPNGPLSYADYLDGKFALPFNPIKTCNSCSFVNSNEILDELVKMKGQNSEASAVELLKKLSIFPDDKVNHKNFI